MSNLATRVDAGVGTPCADDVDRFVGNPSDGEFKDLLNTTADALTLPAVIVCPVVFDTNRQSHQATAH